MTPLAIEQASAALRNIREWTKIKEFLEAKNVIGITLDGNTQLSEANKTLFGLTVFSGELAEELERTLLAHAGAKIDYWTKFAQHLGVDL